MPYVRCSHCDARRTLNRHPDDYIRVPRCRSCGQNRYRVDKYRARFERGPKHRCTCYRYHFPHRRGSGYCDHNPKMTIEMLAAREGIDLAHVTAQLEPEPCPF